MTQKRAANYTLKSPFVEEQSASCIGSAMKHLRIQICTDLFFDPSEKQHITGWSEAHKSNLTRRVNNLTLFNFSNERTRSQFYRGKICTRHKWLLHEFMLFLRKRKNKTVLCVIMIFLAGMQVKLWWGLSLKLVKKKMFLLTCDHSWPP